MLPPSFPLQVQRVYFQVCNTRLPFTPHLCVPCRHAALTLKIEWDQWRVCDSWWHSEGVSMCHGCTLGRIEGAQMKGGIEAKTWCAICVCFVSRILERQSVCSRHLLPFPFRQLLKRSKGWRNLVQVYKLAYHRLTSSRFRVCGRQMRVERKLVALYVGVEH